MKCMFTHCTKLKQIIGLNKFNTTKVTDMEGIFQQCKELEYLDLSNFNTVNVINMRCMFTHCTKLKQINGLSKLNTTKVTNMEGMFQLCRELECIDLSNFNTINVKIMRCMFNKCHKLKQIIGLNKFNTYKVNNMYGMFNECNELKNIDLCNFNTINVIDFCIMFQECYELEYVDISNFNFKSAKDIRWMFNKCYKLKELKGINIIKNFTNIKKIGIFDDCPKLINLPKYESNNKKNIIKKQINIKFTSIDQKILNYCVTCNNTDIFEDVLEKVFLKYPELKDKEIFCLCSGTIINGRVSLAENNIADNSCILIYIND